MDKAKVETQEIRLSDMIDQLLSENGKSRNDIICIRWGSAYRTHERCLSIGLESFWEYAENTVFDYAKWATVPHYPLHLLSGKGWWIESTEYDSRTSLKYMEEPKPIPAANDISIHGEIMARGSPSE